MGMFRFLSKKLEKNLEFTMPEFELKCDPARSPIIEIEISSPREEFGTPIKTRALIDTGADKTVISESKIKDVQLIALPKSKDEKIRLANGGFEDFNLYLANIKLISPDLEYDCGLIEVLAIDTKNDTELCLIGINILAKGKFTYDGRNAQFSLTFPD